VYLALLAVLSFFFPWGESSLRKKVTIASPFFILFILPVFTEGWWKYLVPYAPLLVILAAAGLVFGVDRLLQDRRRMGTAVIALCTIIIMTYYVDRYSGGLMSMLMPPKTGTADKTVKREDPSRTARLNYAEDARKAGQWAAARYGAGKNYMFPWNKMIYYLNGLWTPLPVASSQETYAYAIRNRVDLLVFEIAEPKIPDSALAGAAPGFKLDSVYHSETSPYRVAFYRPLIFNQ
jgi:hypothetical protein